MINQVNLNRWNRRSYSLFVAIVRTYNAEYEEERDLILTSDRSEDLYEDKVEDHCKAQGLEFLGYVWVGEDTQDYIKVGVNS